MGMSSAEFAALTMVLGLTRQDLAAELGVGERTVQSWIEGRAAVPARVPGILTRLLDEQQALVEEYRQEGQAVIPYHDREGDRPSRWYRAAAGLAALHDPIRIDWAPPEPIPLTPQAVRLGEVLCAAGVTEVPRRTPANRTAHYRLAVTPSVSIGQETEAEEVMVVLGFSRTPHEDWSRWITRLAAGIPDGHNPIRLVPAPDGGLVWTTPPAT